MVTGVNWYVLGAVTALCEQLSFPPNPFLSFITYSNTTHAHSMADTVGLN